MTKKIFVVYIILVHAFLLLILLKSDFIKHVEQKISLSGTHQELTKHYYEMLEYHKRMDGNIPQDAIIFIGDSLTQSLSVSAVMPNSVNFGIGMDTSFGVIKRINEYQSIKRARVVVIAIGINDLKIRGQKEILSNFVKIIQLIPTTTQILFNSLHPVNENFINNFNRRNDTINYLNRNLEKICLEYTNVKFLDISKSLIDNTGNLSNKYHIGDGLHLNSEGYKVWINHLNRKLKEISSYER